MRMVFPPHATGRFINELTSDVNALVESIFGDEREGAPQHDATFTPRMDVVETEQGFQLSLDLPGVNPDEIQIELDGETVTIHGHRKHESVEQKDGTRRRVERVFGEFRRTVQLPKTVDKEAIEADYVDGVLTVTVPKAVPADARKVTVHRGRRADATAGTDTSCDAESADE